MIRKALIIMEDAIGYPYSIKDFVQHSKSHFAGPVKKKDWKWILEKALEKGWAVRVGKRYEMVGDHPIWHEVRLISNAYAELECLVDGEQLYEGLPVCTARSRVQRVIWHAEMVLKRMDENDRK